MPTLADLKQIAKDNKIKGYSTLKKAELVELLKKNGIGVEESPSEEKVYEAQQPAKFTPLKQIIASISSTPVVLLYFKRNAYLIPIADVVNIKQLQEDARNFPEKWTYPNGKQAQSLIEEVITYAVKKFSPDDLIEIPEEYKIANVIFSIS